MPSKSVGPIGMSKLIYERRDEYKEQIYKFIGILNTQFSYKQRLNTRNFKELITNDSTYECFTGKKVPVCNYEAYFYYALDKSTDLDFYKVKEGKQENCIIFKYTDKESLGEHNSNTLNAKYELFFYGLSHKENDPPLMYYDSGKTVESVVDYFNIASCIQELKAHLDFSKLLDQITNNVGTKL